MTFQDYLISKKIDARAFLEAEPEVFANWEAEFGQMHPNSFTVQKLNLINPIRRKYLLAQPPAETKGESLPPTPSSDNPPVVAAAPKVVARPMMKPKPKMN